MGVGGVLEGASYFTFFWMFVFSSEYRRQNAQEWRSGGWPKRTVLVVEAASSIFVGLVLPILITWYASVGAI